MSGNAPSLPFFTGTHVGVVSFSSSAQTEISFKDQQNVDEIKASVSAIKYHTGGTRIDLGLNKSHTELFSAEHGRRANVPHILLAITDGKSAKGKVLDYKGQRCSRP